MTSAPSIISSFNIVIIFNNSYLHNRWCEFDQIFTKSSIHVGLEMWLHCGYIAAMHGGCAEAFMMRGQLSHCDECDRPAWGVCVAAGQPPCEATQPRKDPDGLLVRVPRGAHLLAMRGPQEAQAYAKIVARATGCRNVINISFSLFRAALRWPQRGNMACR